MIIVVCGLGSMGTRRIRLLRQIQKDLKIVGVDSNLDRTRKVSSEFNIQTYSSLQEAYKQEKPECAFICTSPLSHHSLIIECLELGMHVFTEINVVSDGYSEMIELANKRGLKLFLSSTMNYKSEIRYIIDRVSKEKNKVSYNYHIGQYLPDWHPWENYKSFFVSNERTGGCREILAIEVPWIVKCFGKIKSFKIIKSKISELEVNYPDTLLILLEHENGNVGCLNIDIVSRKAIRRFEAISEKLFLTWNGTIDSLASLDLKTKQMITCDFSNNFTHLDNYSHLIIEEPYRDEINAFFNYVENGVNPIYGFEDDKHVLDMLDKMEGDS